MTFRRPLQALSLVGVAVGAVVVAPPAQAALKDCEPAKVCGWSEYYYSGLKIDLQPGAGCVDTRIPLRSIAHTFGSPGIPVRAIVYSGSGCTGAIVGDTVRSAAVPVIVPAGLSVYLVW